MNELPPCLKEEVMREIGRRRSLTRADRRAQRGILLAAAAILVGGVSFLQGVPSPTVDRPAVYLLVISGFALTTALAASYWVFTSGGSSLGRPRSTLRALSVALPLALVAGAVVAAVLAPETSTLSPRAWTSHAVCLGIHLALGGALLALALRGLRPLDPIHPALTGAGLGAAVAGWASLAVALQCPHPDPIHVMLTHVAPAALLVGLGALLGRRLLAIRFEDRR